MRRLIPALVLALVVSACGGGNPGESPGAAGESGAPPSDDVEQVLRVNLGNEPPTLDPTLAEDSVAINVLRSITRPLAYYDENLEVVPGLAESWEISEDGQTITFTLKQGITYSDGSPIVAEDFVRSWKRLVDPRNAASYAYVMADVVGGEELLGVDTETATDEDIEALLDAFGVSAPDESTFVVSLARPAAYFVYITALWMTVPQPDGAEFSEADGYVGSGPMKLVEWDHSAQIVLEPNENWTAGPAPTIERIEMAMIQDPAAGLAAYEAGEIDVSLVPTQEISRIQGDPVLSNEVLQGDVLSIYYFGFDLKDPEGPFTNSVLLRQAFNEAIDKETMIATTFAGLGTPAHSLVPPGMPGHQDFDLYPYDPEKAKADFDQALDDLGLSADELALEVGFNTDANHEDKVAFLQEQWRQAFGIDVTPAGLEWGAYLDRLNTDPFDIFRLGWGADYPHPNNFLTDLMVCGGGNNNMGYCNEEVDALLQEAAVAPTLEEQLPLYNQAQEMIMADAPILPLRFGAQFTLVKPWVQNLVATAQDSNAGELFYDQVTIAAHD
ncbi:MAG TPA: peptide ABC transporter substrate-binding protein [Candidatus Limnocylindria bacterium]|nr:peptide ABC transporter substrate-binding protein [Candidatus Limnocylindria bacterium]